MAPEDSENSVPAPEGAGTSDHASGDHTFDDRADIADAVRGAQLLLSYATERGLDIDPTAVTTIVQSKFMLRAGQWSPEKEVALWTALNTAAKAVKPVSVTSLKYLSDASLDRAGVSVATSSAGGVSVARRAVTYYGRRFFWWLIVLLFVQMYWLVGASITSDFEAIPTKVADLNSQINKLKLAGRAPDEREIKSLQTEIDNEFTRAGTRIEVLQKWNSIWDLSFLSRSDTGSGESDFAKINDRALLTAGFVLTAMRVYLLPLLYGLVGACAYILRNLSTEIENRTFSAGSETEYRLRFYLGAIAGMAVGWFLTSGNSTGITPSTPGLLQSISPFALAFLAGYNVEVLFSAMDRFISAVSSGSAGRFGKSTDGQ